MARRVHDARLDSRDARRGLKARGKPYWRQLEPGVSIGYRKALTTTGKWVLRLHVNGKNNYITETFATADDFSDADGVAVLDFWQAQNRTRQRMVERAHSATGVSPGLKTVGDALDSYIDYLETERKSAKEARYAIDAIIRPELGHIKLNSLTTEQIRKWLKGVAASGARVRTKAGEKQNYKKDCGDAKLQERRRKSTANRILTKLKAALNRAWRDGHVASDAAWRRVEPFKNVDAARVRYLSTDEIPRFLRGIETNDFRELAQGALVSGARYSELYGFLVGDFNPDAGTLSIPYPKTGKARHIILGKDGIDFFLEITAGRNPAHAIFLKADGSKWKSDHQKAPMRKANEAAKLSPRIGFHGLRHTWASHAVMNGMPLKVVAENLGHTTITMVEKHYGHLAPSFIADAVRRHAPSFRLAGEGNVAKLRPRANGRKHAGG
jgi:integrase